MTTRAKFKVTSILTGLSTRRVVDNIGTVTWPEAPIITVKLAPVYGNGDAEHENTKFWDATPSGSIELGIMNEEAAAIFVLGKEYYVDFSVAPAAAPVPVEGPQAM